MIDNFLQMQKNFFENWNKAFQEQPTKFDFFNLQSDLIHPFFKMDKSNEIFGDFTKFYNDFQKTFFQQNTPYNFFDFQQQIKKFQENYNDIIFKIFGLSDITPDKILENFSKPLNQLGIFDTIKPFLNNPSMDFSKLFNNYNSGTFEEFIKMPSFWLTREYNDLIKNLINDFKNYMEQVEKFKKVINEQAEKGFKLFIEEVTKKPEFTDFDTFFKKWIEKNEEIFHEFFKSKEYITILKELLKAGASLKSSLDKYTFEVLKDTNIATKTELDRAYKDIYNIKKELKEIKAQLKSHTHKEGGK